MISIKTSDRLFVDSPDAGDPDCRCSRCGKLITEDEAPAIRMVVEGKYEYRYHARCLGLHEAPA